VTSEPLLVYNRIDCNKRLTRVMLLAFAVAMLPSVTAASVHPPLEQRIQLLARMAQGIA
jgi:Zn-dependent protease with chaperone function